MCAKLIQICYLGQFFKNGINNHKKAFFEKLLDIYVNPIVRKQQSQWMNKTQHNKSVDIVFLYMQGKEKQRLKKVNIDFYEFLYFLSLMKNIKEN